MSVSDIVIRCQGIGKKYKIGREIVPRTLTESVSEKARRVARRLARLGRCGAQEDTQEPIIWALDNVTFDVKRGEILGIIGANGAGKSTLLKLLSRITKPSTGWATVKGSVGAVLEVGTGFHPELTGRENIVLSGAILGMRRCDIAARFNDIVDFSGVSSFLDTPVKRYSSGMFLRLAFAVAAHLEPEILIMDEVLAVGDASFQRKCLKKTGEVARAGRTVVFVSHNMTAVQSLCDRVIWLDNGRIAASGHTVDVVSQYLRNTVEARHEQVWPDFSSAPGNDRVRLCRLQASTDEAPLSDHITTDTPIRLTVEIWNLVPGSRLSLSLHVYTESGTLAFAAVPVDEPVWLDREYPVGLFRDTCTIPGNFMNDGIHRVDLFVLEDHTRIIFHYPEALFFSVADTAKMRGAYYGKWPGAVRPLFPWQTELMESKSLLNCQSRPSDTP